MNTTSNSLIAKLWTLSERVIEGLNALRPLALLAARLYIANVFFSSGLVKISNFDTTLALFMDEYHVPLLNPTLAAYLGTAAELTLPVFMVLGLAGRFTAAGMFMLNLVAVLSLAEVAPAALQQHVFWGSLITGLLLWGPGSWSADRFVTPWLKARLTAGNGLPAGYAGAASPSQG